MGKRQRRLTRDLEAEAVRLVETSGRTQKEIATDLGIGLSTLRASCFLVYAYPAFLMYAGHSLGLYWVRISPQASETVS